MVQAADADVVARVVAGGTSSKVLQDLQSQLTPLPFIPTNRYMTRVSSELSF